MSYTPTGKRHYNTVCGFVNIFGKKKRGNPSGTAETGFRSPWRDLRTCDRMVRNEFQIGEGKRRMDGKKLLREGKNLLIVTAGSIIYGMGIECFLDSNHIGTGGISGLAMILCHFLPLSTGLMTFLLNVPLFVAGFIRFRGRFLVYTLYSLSLSSWSIDFIASHYPAIAPVTPDLMLAAVAGGACMALGMGMVTLCGGSTGGSDILIKFLRQRFKHIKSGTLSVIIDLALAVVSCIVFGSIGLGLYAVVVLFVYGFVTDYVLYGGNEEKLIFVISDETERISDRLMNELGHGVTWLDGTGAWTGEGKKVILTAFRKQNYHLVRDVVKTEDPGAFMIVTSANEIFGEGFKDHFADEI